MLDVNIEFFNEKRKEIYKILVYAQENVPFYRNMMNYSLPSFEEFSYEFFTSNVKPLSKLDIQSAGKKLISDKYNFGELFSEATSGSEGQPLIVYKSKPEKLRCSLDLWKRRRKHVPDLSPDCKFARFYAMRPDREKSALVNNEIYIKDNDLHIPLSNMGGKKLTSICEKLSEFSPRWIHGPSTAIFNIAVHAKQKGISISNIELVELNGEFVKTEHVEVISETFDCPVVNNYGCREFWTNAYSSKDGKLRIIDNSLYVESVKNKESGNYELLFTSLRNYAWPLIRYKVGDVGSVYKSESKENFTGEYCIDLQRGRIADYLELAGGQRINAVLFSGITRGLQLLLGYSAIRQYQVIKLSDERIKVLICISESVVSVKKLLKDFDTAVKQVITSPVSIDYQVVAQIQPDPITGKVRDFIDMTVLSKIRKLVIFNQEGVNLEGTSIVRTAIKGITVRANKLLMLYSTVNGDYKFPGGGKEEFESEQQTLNREFLEECGYSNVVIDYAFGEVEENKIARDEGIDLFKMLNRYYFCSIGNEQKPPTLEADEIELGLIPVWVDIDEAIVTNENHIANGISSEWVERETFVLKQLREMHFGGVNE
ncbi:TPA: NUDIX domain-containing protein [Vibrio parahaemolyticus]|nr:NUDIX domain-containing protein [Vibrio parahaemolyticus]